MEASKILQTTLLDLVFENRNKQYGAYELRKNYSRRTITAITITFCTVASIIGITSYSQQHGPAQRPMETETVRLVSIEPETQPVVPPPVQPPVAPPPQARTVEFVEPVIVDDKDFTEPMATQDDLVNAQISDVTTDGPDATGIAEPPAIPGAGEKTGIIEPKKTSDEPLVNVTTQAAFLGNWVRFLEKNLRADVPVENGAPSGQHKVIIEFVVDIDGSMSKVKAMTSLGYGMEEEAMRVIKKAGKWSPAIWQGEPVKAYRRQQITFEITGND